MSDIYVSPDRAAYRILAVNGWYGPNDHLYREGDTVYYEGEPNEEMEPLNDLARKALDAFYAKVDAGAREFSTKLGRAYRPRIRLEDRLRAATAGGRRIQLVAGDGGIPLMKGVDERRISQVEDIAEPEKPVMGQAKRRGRPPKVLANVPAPASA